MSETTIQQINRCFMRFRDRAERSQLSEIVSTFVSVGPLMDVLGSENNQILYGRRGTGKTHALLFLGNQARLARQIPVYIDCQTIGSNQSTYEDKSLPLAERATRLLIDVCSALHNRLLDLFSDPREARDLSLAAPLLDRLVGAISEVRVVGPVEVESRADDKETDEKSGGYDFNLAKTPTLTLRSGDDNKREADRGQTIKRSGEQVHWVTFGYLSRCIKELADFCGTRLLILIDEWSTVPPDIQPYLADFLKRVFFTTKSITVKIAAIEQRSRFQINKTDGGYIGLELGADISPAVNLDDYLVFDNNEARATSFFRTLIGNHMRYVAQEIDLSCKSLKDAEIVYTAFSRIDVFSEFVKATEGVPRDAMHILCNAAQRASDQAITMPTLRSAAWLFFQTEKYSVIQANPENRKLLDWIRDEVIGTRKTRAFLLPIGDQDDIIDRLFDQRALHIKSRSQSSQHNPGERYTVYKLDYGCYADLINTNKAPLGYVFENLPDFDVPDDDGRSYRRAILDLATFYQASGE